VLRSHKTGANYEIKYPAFLLKTVLNALFFK
jgi:hypothetical protein